MMFRKKIWSIIAICSLMVSSIMHAGIWSWITWGAKDATDLALSLGSSTIIEGMQEDIKEKIDRNDRYLRNKPRINY